MPSEPPGELLSWGARRGVLACSLLLAFTAQAQASDPPSEAAPDEPSPGQGSGPVTVGTTAAASAVDRKDPGGFVESEITLSPYEQDTVTMALERLGTRRAESAEGKIIESVEIWPLRVLEERDPLPKWSKDVLNWFHYTSRPFVIERELFQRIGDRYREDLARETERNLRSLRAISLALVFPVEGSAPDRVRVVVITKDIWSLRLNSNFRFAGGQLEYLFLQPSEENLLGTHHSVSGQFELEPDVYSLGGRYRIPRIDRSRIEGVVSANMILNRDTGQAEGSFGSLAYGQPLYSKEAEWAWIGSVAWRNEITRRFVGTQLVGYDADVTRAPDLIPFTYKSDSIQGEFVVTRSFGGTYKHDFTGGMLARREVYRTEDLSAFDPRAVDEFRQQALPVTDTRIHPYLQYRTRTTRFAQLVNFNTLGLQEDYRLGHEIILRAYPVTKALNSTRNFMGLFASAAYTHLLGNGLTRVYAESTHELEAERIADASINVGGRIVTPRLGFGRLVFDAGYLNRYRNYLNQQSLLGGNTRLRGYPTDAFIGQDVVVGNLEFRARPVELWTVQVGATAFFDTGEAYFGQEDFELKHSTGLGLRILFPQLDRSVLRLDWGVPLQAAPEVNVPAGLPGDFIVTLRQAFPMPDVPVDLP